jgi:hypothetical protein
VHFSLKVECSGKEGGTRGIVGLRFLGVNCHIFRPH